MILPRKTLVRRVRNDLLAVQDDLCIEIPDVPDEVCFPFEVTLCVRDIEGYSAPGVPSTEHAFTVIFSEDYPYERPRVRWASPIFHPNIMPPNEGGLVCVVGINHWDFDSDLRGFVRSLTDLINNPNPDNPQRSPACEEAAEWFRNNS